MHKFLTLLTCVLAAILISIPFFCSNIQLTNLCQEGQALELLTVFVFAIAALFLCYKKLFDLSIILAIITARELDLHKFMGDSFLKLKFYTHENDLYKKILGVALILAITYIVIKTIIKYTPQVIKDFFRLIPYSLALCFSVGIMVVAKSLDTAPRFFRKRLDITFDDLTLDYMRYTEESLELFCSILIVISIAYFMIGRKQKA